VQRTEPALPNVIRLVVIAPQDCTKPRRATDERPGDVNCDDSLLPLPPERRSNKGAGFTVRVFNLSRRR